MYDVIIVGGGQAGLTAGFMLQQQKLKYLILDAGSEVGNSWRKRFSSLHLFTPNRLNRLAGLGTPTSDKEYMNKDEFADYLAQYAELNKLAIELNTRVRRVKRIERQFELLVESGGVTRILSSRQIILATGAFSSPLIPSFASRVPRRIHQFTANDLADFTSENKNVLIVGDGASGRQIASNRSMNLRY